MTAEPVRLPVPNPVAIVVVTWDSADEIEQCLASARAQNPAEIVVVDNGSEDDTVARVRECAPSAKIVELGTNRGFAVGCNIGIANSTAPFVLFLNDDARLDAGYAETLLRLLHREVRAASAIGKLVFKEDGVQYIDSAGIEMAWYALRPDDRGHRMQDRGQFDTREEIFGPSGAAAMYRRIALEEVGPEVFDEDFFAYYEDVDLAWRLRRCGWKHIYEPAARAEHTRRGPVRDESLLAARAFANRYLVWLKNESPWRFAAYAPVAIPWELLRIARRALSVPGTLGGLRHMLRRGRMTMRKRQRFE